MPRSLTEDTVSTVLLSNLIVSFEYSWFCLSNMIAWNFSRLTIILLLLNQFIIASDSDCKVFFNSVTVFVAAEKDLSSAKLYIDALETKKSKSFIGKLNRIGPAMEP